MNMLSLLFILSRQYCVKYYCSLFSALCTCCIVRLSGAFYILQKTDNCDSDLLFHGSREWFHI